MVLFAGIAAPGMASEAAATAPATATAAQVAHAKYKVRGMGLFGNLKMERLLGLLETEEMPLLEVDSVFVEDSIVLLQSALERDGFLAPSGVAEVYQGRKLVGSFPWKRGDVPLLPRDLRGDLAVFRVDKGKRHYYSEIEFEGLTALSREEAEAFFVGKSFLFDEASARRFTPGGLRTGIGNLREQLVRDGYADCEVTLEEQSIDSVSGRVHVRIKVREGTFHRVGSVEPPESVPDVAKSGIQRILVGAVGAPWSPFWEESFSQRLRGILYAEGFPRASVRVDVLDKKLEAGETVVALGLSVAPGPRVRVGRVTFSGDEKTRRSLLNRTITLVPGDWYRRSDVEITRSQISSLGIFSSVRPRITEVENGYWDIDYELTPSRRLEVSALAGYGSYERFRAGVEVYHANFLGRATRGRLEMILSTKSASANYDYTVPRIFGTAADATAQIYGLGREEVSFDRREYGVSVGARREDLIWGMDGSMRYKFERLKAEVTDPDSFASPLPNSRVGAVTFDFVRDDRDNPISPRTGASYGLSFETAARAIGGNVDFQKAEFRGSWHVALGHDNTFRAGVRHGVVFPLRSGDEVPLGRRYFPGGENTIRGYSEGTAAPRNSEGTFVGAEVATIVNLELDQALARSFYAVAFVDAGLTGVDITDYPGDELRVSAGVGLRYFTIIGPVRLEYAHNVVKQTGDQNGQLHFSLGFPF